MDNFIVEIVVTLLTVMVPVINYSNGIDINFFERSFKVKTFVHYNYFCEITDQFWFYLSW